MCKWILLFTLLLISGCVAQTHPDGSLVAQRNNQAMKEYRLCMKYMATRGWDLVYPDPLVYCRAVQMAIRTSQRVEDWRI